MKTPILREDGDMKCLKIEDNKGSYSLDGQNFKAIDEIDKNDLLKLLDLALGEEFEMDEYKQESIGNQAHQIIDKFIYEKFKELNDNRTRFKDESHAQYKEAIEKYS